MYFKVIYGYKKINGLRDCNEINVTQALMLIYCDIKAYSKNRILTFICNIFV